MVTVHYGSSDGRLGDARCECHGAIDFEFTFNENKTYTYIDMIEGQTVI